MLLPSFACPAVQQLTQVYTTQKCYPRRKKSTCSARTSILYNVIPFRSVCSVRVCLVSIVPSNTRRLIHRGPRWAACISMRSSAGGGQSARSTVSGWASISRRATTVPWRRGCGSSGSRWNQRCTVSHPSTGEIRIFSNSITDLV